MSLVKTKRDALPTAITTANPALAERVSREGEEQVFRALEAQVCGDDFAFPSHWPDVAASDTATRQWILHGLDLMARDVATAGPAFSGVRAVSLLLGGSRRRRHEPGTPGFEREILTITGWLEAALPASITPPDEPTLARLAEIYGDPAPGGRFNAAVLTTRLRAPLKAALAEQARWWTPPGDGPIELEDLAWIEEVAAAIQRFVHYDAPPYAAAWAAGPLYDGYDFATRVVGVGALPGDEAARLRHLRNEAHRLGRDQSTGSALGAAGYDNRQAAHREALDDLLRLWLATDPELNELTGRLLPRSAPHLSGLSAGVYVPAHVPTRAWGPVERWRPHLYRTMVHEFLHRLAHPDFQDAALTVADGRILEEGVVDVLTVALVTSSAVDSELGGLVPANLRTGHGTSGQAAEEIRDLVGTDRFWAAFFLGRTEFIGL